MTVCPQCKAEVTPEDPAGLCAACLLVGVLGSGFGTGEPELETVTAHKQQPAGQDSFGPYRILRVLGEGGMGAVYLAEQTEPIRRRVALKIVKLGMDTNQVLARFKQERQSLARMEHSNIARILDAGASSQGRPFFVMDYIEGQSITAYCDLHQLTMAQRLELYLPVCRAVQHAHDRGVIHRDIKPSNVLVTVEDGKPVPKVIDFGIARAIDEGEERNTAATQFGQMVGTPEYASPEQADLVSGEIGPATDVYSLGVLLYELLIGTVPFDGALLRKAGRAEMLRIIREEEPPLLVEKFSSDQPAADIATCRGTNPASLRKILAGDLNWIVKKALEKSPQRRYISPSELAADIERHLNGEVVLAGPPRRTRGLRKPLAGAAVMLLLVPAAWLIKRLPRYGPAPEIAATIVLSDVENTASEPSLDSTVRQSISFELQRATKLKLLPDNRVAEILIQMRKPRETRLTPEIAREICERTGSAAFIESSVAKDGSAFLLALRARNCTAGDLVHEEQARAVGKEDVINQLRRLTVSLESKSAASIAVLQKNAARLEEATTSSLDALKSFSAAKRQMYASEPDSLPLFKRATEIDPQFALAYAWLGRAYADSGEQKMAAESIRHAYLMRGMVTDREDLFITYNYDRDVLRNLELCRQICDSWIAKYPGDMQPHAFLSGLTSKGAGQYERSIEEGEKAIGLDPDFTVGYENIAESYLFLNRLEDLKAILRLAAQRKLASKNKFALQFLVAFLNGDRSAMEQAAAQIATVSPHGDSEHFQSLVSAFEGRLQQSRQAAIQAVALARQAHLAERAALFEGEAAVRDALYGYPGESARHAAAAGQLVNGRDVDFPRAFALALSRNSSAALGIATRLERDYPEDTCVRFTYSPAVRALLAINEGNPAKALELLTVSKPYEFAQTGVSLYVYYGALYPTYVRGLAYQHMHRYREAAGEFQRMLDHPGLLLADPIGPATRVQLVRALRDAGETAEANAAYQNFLALWKNADSDIPLLQQARAEFARL